MAKNPKTGLTDKQEQFCREYLKDFNATAAYIRAGYSAKGESARRAASRLLTNVDVQVRLAEKITQSEQESDISLARTVREVGRIAFSDITHALKFDSDGVQFKPSKDLSKRTTASISKVSSTKTIVRIKDTETETINMSLQLHSKTFALDWLGKYFAIAQDLNSARAALLKYGVALIADDSTETGWRLEPYDADTAIDAAPETEQASDEFTEAVWEEE
ncbi:MAG: terminase small subunit [Cyanobacteria bacterium P01_F01_bin.56]